MYIYIYIYIQYIYIHTVYMYIYIYTYIYMHTNVPVMCWRHGDHNYPPQTLSGFPLFSEMPGNGVGPLPWNGCLGKAEPWLKCGWTVAMGQNPGNPQHQNSGEMDGSSPQDMRLCRFQLPRWPSYSSILFNNVQYTHPGCVTCWLDSISIGKTSECLKLGSGGCTYLTSSTGQVWVSNF